MTLITEQAYVTGLYTNILFRSPSGMSSASDQSDITQWASSINSGQLTELQAATAIANSPEAARNVLPVVSLYQDLLKRTPETGGVGYYATQIASGTPLSVIAQDFVASPEFAAIYGTHMTGTAFVTALYQNVLGRTPDSAGMSYYLSILGGSASTPTVAQMATVAVDFLQSPEALHNSSANIQAWLVNGAQGQYSPAIGPVYLLTNGGTATATEGSTVTFQLSTTAVAPGSTFAYTLSGVTASAVVGGKLTGTVTIGPNGTATIPVNLTAIAGAGLSGALTATIATPGVGTSALASASATLIETAVGVPLYTLTETTSQGTTTATEGSTVNFHLSTLNVAAGSTLSYTLSGVTAAAVVGGLLTGTVTVASDGTANFPVTLISTPGAGLAGNLTATLAVPANAASASVASASVGLVETTGAGGPTLVIPGGTGGTFTAPAADTGGVTIGTANGSVEPTGAITITDLAATGPVNVYGGAGITVTTFSSGGVQVGNQSIATDPTGAVTVTDNATSGAIQIYGGAGVTVTTASVGGVTVGTPTGTWEPGGAITITDTASTGALHLYGGAAVSITSASTSPIVIGVAGVPAADPNGTVTITNVLTNSTTFLNAQATIFTNGGNSVIITGTSGDIITDASATNLLANITLDGVGGANTITTNNALVSLTVLDGAASSRETIVNSAVAGHTLALAIGSTTSTTTPVFANVTDATATTVTVGPTTGTMIETLKLSVVSATTISLGAHNGPDSITVGLVAAGATTPSVIITGAVVGDSLQFGDTATSTATLTAGQQTAVSGAATFAAAVNMVDGLSSTIAHSATAFTYAGATYVLESSVSGSGSLHAGDSLIELIGVHTLSAPSAGVVALAS